MAYTDQEIRSYAYKLQDAGAPPSDIEEFVKRAKKEQAAAAPQPQQQPQQEYNWGSEFAKNLNPVTYAQKAFIPAAAGILDAPRVIAKGAATVSAGPLIAATKQTLTGKGLTDPINVPVLGQINPNANTPWQNVGLAGDVAFSGANLLNPTTSVIKSGLRGAGQAMSRQVEEGADNVTQIALAGLMGGVLSAGAQKISNKFTGVDAANKANKVARSSGMLQKNINQVQKVPEAGDKMKTFMAISKQSTEDLDSPTAVDVVGDNLTKGLQKLKSIKDQKGAAIGKIKTGMLTGADVAPDVDLTAAKGNFLKQLQDNRIKIVDGDLDFSQSTFAGLKSEQKLLNSVWERVRNNDFVDAAEGQSIRDNLKNILFVGKTNRITKSDTPAEAIATSVWADITDQIHQHNTALEELDDTFSELSRAVKGGIQATKGTNVLTEDAVITGTNSAGLIRKAFGAGNKQNREVLKKIQAIGQKYGIDELSDIYNTGFLAQTADDAFAVDIKRLPTSLAGRVAQGVSAVVQRSPSQAKEAVFGQPTREAAINTILKGVRRTNPIQQGVKRLTQSPVTQLLKVGLPQKITADYIEFLNGFRSVHPTATEDQIKQAYDGVQ